jgi:hypothetical protein
VFQLLQRGCLCGNAIVLGQGCCDAVMHAIGIDVGNQSICLLVNVLTPNKGSDHHAGPRKVSIAQDSPDRRDIEGNDVRDVRAKRQALDMATEVVRNHEGSIENRADEGVRLNWSQNGFHRDHLSSLIVDASALIIL